MHPGVVPQKTILFAAAIFFFYIQAAVGEKKLYQKNV